MAEEKTNSIPEIRDFFERDSRPLAQGEFMQFWKSLSEEDKAEFYKADLS